MKFWENITEPLYVLAPMVGNSEQAWRKLARRYGANICYTEMIQCQSFLRGKTNPINNKWYTTSAEDRPLIIQLCGNDPNIMLQVAEKVEKYCDAIDINFGCPQEVARKGNYGAYLQDDWELTHKIVNLLSTNLSVPVTCKIRVFESIDKTVEYSKMIENAGCSLLVVHGRTKEQKGQKSGFASWDHIKAVKRAIKIPVVSNGNVIYNRNIIECLEYTGCDGVMVGETHLYDPLIFSNIKKTSLEILEEYLAICAENDDMAESHNIRSHFFKILHTIFKHFPDWRETLSKCYLYESYVIFLNKLNEEIEASGIKKQIPDILELKPYIREINNEEV